MGEMICIATFRTRMEAEFAQSMLEAEGMAAQVTADDAGGWRPELLMGAGGARLYVRPDDAERARQALATVEEVEAAEVGDEE
jgi:hypothetical protein